MRRTDAAAPDTTTTDTGSLSVIRSTPDDPAGSGFEIYIAIDASGQVFAYNGHVDLGTGIRTALTQIVAEELDVALDRVAMVLGDTTKTPNQGPTIASETIQITAVPLRNAAAQARQYLLARAAEQLDQPRDSLSIEDGLIRAQNNHSVSYAELVAGKTVRLELDRREGRRLLQNRRPRDPAP